MIAPLRLEAGIGVHHRTKLRSSSPLETTSTKASATSAAARSASRAADVTPASVRPPSLQCVADAGPREAQRRREPEWDRAQKRSRPPREPSTLAVDRDGLQSRQVGGSEAGQRGDLPRTRARCRCAPPAAARTTLSTSSWRARRHRVAPSAARTPISRDSARRPAEQQAGDVHTREQQHRRGRAGEHEQRRFRRADDLVFSGTAERLPWAVRVRVALRDARAGALAGPLASRAAHVASRRMRPTTLKKCEKRRLGCSLTRDRERPTRCRPARRARRS